MYPWKFHLLYHYPLNPLKCYSDNYPLRTSCFEVVLVVSFPNYKNLCKSLSFRLSYYPIYIYYCKIIISQENILPVINIVNEAGSPESINCSIPDGDRAAAATVSNCPSVKFNRLHSDNT